MTTSRHLSSTAIHYMASCKCNYLIEHVLSVMLLRLQIIKRARQNYLMEQYVSEDLSLAQVLKDATDAMKVRNKVHTSYTLSRVGLHTGTSHC